VLVAPYAQGGDDVYACWKLSYNEDLFSQEALRGYETWQDYSPGLCPVAEYLQPRLLQFKTNYWDVAEAEVQAATLRKTLAQWAEQN
jgi:perosamine synthetase